MQWNLNSERPVYLQLIEQIQAGIISGYFKPGDKLPSVRDLAADAAVNPNTMQKAFTELERIGLVYTNRTSGRFITSDEKLIKELKEESAINEIKEFIKKMKQLGLDADEIIELIRNLAKEIEI